ncbi:MAG TPA: hypothetical protein VH278_07115, partial [Burkholderiaceae bacterium]|nr:hypothetical protein [Burkholderiaceae bacterium]
MPKRSQIISFLSGLVLAISTLCIWPISERLAWKEYDGERDQYALQHLGHHEKYNSRTFDDWKSIDWKSNWRSIAAEQRVMNGFEPKYDYWDQMFWVAMAFTFVLAFGWGFANMYQARPWQWKALTCCLAG